MSLTVAEAREILAVDGNTTVRGLRRRYRALARERHPDTGGDPDAFRELQQAYEVMRRYLGEDPARDVIRRGAAGYVRPTRPPPVDPDEVDWEEVGGAGARLTRDRLAVRAARGSPVAPTVARSRGPRSPLNWLVPVLSADFSSSLTVRPGSPEEAEVVLRVAQGRMRGRLLDAAVPARWIRTRENRVVTARRGVPTGDDPRVNALRAADVALDLLDLLGWPSSAWRLEGRD